MIYKIKNENSVTLKKNGLHYGFCEKGEDIGVGASMYGVMADNIIKLMRDRVSEEIETELQSARSGDIK